MKTCLSISILALALAASAGDSTGLGLNMANLYLVTGARTRSISPENFGGEKGGAGMATNGTGSHAARDLGRGGRFPLPSTSKQRPHLYWAKSKDRVASSKSG